MRLESGLVNVRLPAFTRQPEWADILASVWTCGAESEEEEWNRASGVKSAAERRDASPDGSQREAATSARFGDWNGQGRAG